MKKKLLVVGQFDYHEDTILAPVLEQITAAEVQYNRLRQRTDFFVPATAGEAASMFSTDYTTPDWGSYTHVFVIDFWFLMLPALMFILSKRMPRQRFPRLSGLFLGGTSIDGDVALEIRGATDYERYLCRCYDTVIVPNAWAASLPMFRDFDNVEVQEYAFDRYLQRQRPSAPQTTTVLNLHRFSHDKGGDRWVEFVRKCRDRHPGKNWRFVQFTDVKDRHDREVLTALGVELAGFVSDDDLLRSYCEGAYIFSGARSETSGYGIVNAVSSGATPLLYYHPCYPGLWSSRYCFDTIDSMVEVAASAQLQYTNTEYENFQQRHRHNAEAAANIILR